MLRSFGHMIEKLNELKEALHFSFSTCKLWHGGNFDLKLGWFFSVFISLVLWRATLIDEYGESFDKACDTKHGTHGYPAPLSVKGEGHNSRGKGVTLSWLKSTLQQTFFSIQSTHFWEISISRRRDVPSKWGGRWLPGKTRMYGAVRQGKGKLFWVC